jgi:S1-C subfamily serine protease
MNSMTRKQILMIIIVAFFVGAAGSVFFNRVVFPKMSVVQGFSWVGRLQSTSPVIINRREEVRLNEGVNLIELTKQAQTVVVSIFSTGLAPELLGNGIIITADGTIFTTKDVLGTNTAVQVVTNDGAVYEGLVRAMDPKSPLAVVTVPGRDMPVAQFFEAANMQTAQRVFALGGTAQEFTRQFASGLVTKTLTNSIDYDRVLSTEIFENTIVTDAILTDDYIGGPVVNLQGLIVGIVVGPNGKILPAEAVQGAVRSYLQSGAIARPYIGLNYQMISKNIARVKGLPESGALVSSVVANSPAATAGLRAGDLIIEINTQRIDSTTLEQVINQQGTVLMNLKVLRAGTLLELPLTVEER